MKTRGETIAEQKITEQEIAEQLAVIIYLMGLGVVTPPVMFGFDQRYVLISYLEYSMLFLPLVKRSMMLGLGLTVFSLTLLAHTLQAPVTLAQPATPTDVVAPTSSDAKLDTKLPAAVAQKLLRQVAKDQQVSMRRLKITEVKSDFLNGCLEIYPVNPAGQPTGCLLKIASLPGYRAIITNDRQTWVYHLYSDASKIAYNPTASRSLAPVRVSYELFGGEPGGLEDNVVFQSMVSGDLTGRTITIKLTRDGKITRFITAPYIRSVPQVIKTLSPQEVDQFQRLLNRQRFPNLNGLSYLTSAALADYPTTTYQTPDTVVQLIDLEKGKLPIALRQIFNAWERLIKSDSPASIN